ncbi:snake venom vascular endothelial growth factor toxin-like [Pantherophis guttatus]|uniref:Snake venom vascular endothelial growth factor toxin-like n=1 Tax=Pantherophis guttatus TaxID=94885 RepID=A0A6P9DDA5_PANGU|nr:snake venom vascular endothelial growth factor toxin-like [Pantherophis guttatus]
MPYMQLYKRSSCQPREVLVDILKEHPQETADFFKPSCIVLQRCAGCCNDDSLKCFTVTKRSVSLQVMRVNPNTQILRMEWMHFTEHLTCECRPRIVNRTKNGKSRKRKRSQAEGEPRARLPFI